MKRLRWLAGLTIIMCLAVVSSSQTYAISQDVIISQLQINNSSAGRLVEIYNNSVEPTDITNWCLYHSSASDKTKDKLYCIDPPNLQTHLILNGGSFGLFGSTDISFEPDFIITGGLGGVTGGHVYIVDQNQVERDRVGWGTAVSAEGNPAIINTANLSHVLQRNIDDKGSYVDSDDNSLDFTNANLRSVYKTGAISEVVDICSNIDGVQVLMPQMFYRDLAGECVPVLIDVCSNIDLIQTIVPDGYRADGNQCIMIDQCSNFPGIQPMLPVGFKAISGVCSLEGLTPIITEVLPNPSGNDSGQEFIEIYNPNNFAFDLESYNLIVSSSIDKVYSFPVDSTIEALSYVVFYNNQMNFTLVNSLGQVKLKLIDGSIVSQSDGYNNPAEGQAWALINGVWQYTNQPTPAADNLNSIFLLPVVAAVEQQPCASNQYRSLDTGRCRLILVATSQARCKDNQYRSEETGRCRNVAPASSLAACGANEERNPDTNRCRSVLGASTTLKPCADNQIRSTDTNRCKTIIKMTEAPFPVESKQVNVGSADYIGWWVAGGVGVLAIGYGIWEWRTELSRIYGFIARKLVIRK